MTFIRINCSYLLMHDNSKLHWQLHVYCISTFIVFQHILYLTFTVCYLSDEFTANCNAANINVVF